MADTYTALLRFILQEDMENVNQWGSIFNSAVTDLVQEAIAEKSIVDVTFGDVVLTSQNGLTDQSRPMFIEAIGDPGTTRTITVPRLAKLYGFGNNTNPSESVQIKTPTSSAIEIDAADSPTIVFVDSVNDTVHTLGRADGLIPGPAWTDIDLYEDGIAGVVVTAKYSKQGDLVTIRVPSFVHTFAAGVATMPFRVGAPAGTLPVPLQVQGTLPNRDPGIPDWIVDNTLGQNLAVHFAVITNVNRIQWVNADVVAMSTAGTRTLQRIATYVYSTKTD